MLRKTEWLYSYIVVLKQAKAHNSKSKTVKPYKDRWKKKQQKEIITLAAKPLYIGQHNVIFDLNKWKAVY